MKQLLFTLTRKDFKINYFSGTGAGGQNRNKCKKCVRIHHPPSNTMATGQDERSLKHNLRNAFIRLTNKPEFRKWLKLQAARECVTIEEIKKLVNDAMDKKDDFLVEYLVNGKWIKEEELNAIK